MQRVKKIYILFREGYGRIQGGRVAPWKYSVFAPGEGLQLWNIFFIAPSSLYGPREAAEKSSFLVAGPLEGGGGLTGVPLRKKELFF